MSSVKKKPAKVAAKSRKPVRAVKKAVKKLAAPARKVVIKKSTKSAQKKTAAPKAKARPGVSAAKAREAAYTQLFGPSHPKGKGLNISGEPMTPAEFAEQGWSILQFPPRPGRLSWIYATHGLSTAVAKGKDKPTRTELVVHWRVKDTLPLQLLSDAAKYILETGTALSPGHLITADEGISVDADLARHCMAFSAAPALPAGADLSSSGFTPVILLGISDAELEYALKVRPELADGRQVLMEALRSGGVYPVSDPKRLCLTRRRDFLRIWETAFRTVRENKV